MKVYTYTVSGSGGDGQTFLVEGTFESSIEDLFIGVMQRTFDALTKGKAVFGKPGLGCNGPYDIHRLVIAQVIH